MLLLDIIYKIKYDKGADRIGPDLLFTHWQLYFKKTMRKLCKKKFGFFGYNSEFRPGAYAVGCSKIHIGNNVIIRPGTMLFGDAEDLEKSIIIEDKVLMGSCIHIYVTNHKFTDTETLIYDQGHSASKMVILETGCWIGANVTILPGVVIGKNSVVAAGSIVTKVFPANVVIAGNPAKIIKHLD